jgi:putative ABC transport system ATP-binding protein
LPDIFAQATRREHTAVVMVTHDERLLTECDRVLTIQDGKLQESTPEQASQQV